MKIAEISNQTSFQHNVATKPSKLANLLYSAALSASLISATSSDVFTKTEEPTTNNIVQIEPTKAQYGQTQTVINKAFGKESNSDVGSWVMLGAFALCGFIYSTFFDGKPQN